MGDWHVIENGSFNKRPDKSPGFGRIAWRLSRMIGTVMSETTATAPQAGDTGTARKLPKISFEFFPPKTEEMERNLWETIKRLAPLEPSFVSVTYGAGGSTRDRTHATIARILKETRLTPAAHLTCVDASRGEVDDVVAQYHDVGVRHIVALRGDPSAGAGTAYQPHPDGYQTSADLVAGIKKRYPDIEVFVSAYPEKHPESAQLRCRHRPAAGQDRRRRDARHHQLLLRQRHL